MDDPFAIFGDDGGEATSPVIPPAKRSRDVMAELHSALQLFTDAAGQTIRVPPPPAERQPLDVAARAAALAVWPTHVPRLVGPIALSSDMGAVGGSRGFVAARDVFPGEVLMAEMPLLRWPSAERAALPLLRQLLEAPDHVFEAAARLHPERLECVELQLRERLAREYASTIDALLPVWRAREAARCEAEGSGTAINEAIGDASCADTTSAEAARVRASEEARASLLRLCLVVQFNAFEGGLFLHQALFNHAPARHANADKVTIECRDGSVDGREGLCTLSVIRATRPIAKGDECMICYLQPLELSALRSEDDLRHQWDFLPRCDYDEEWDALQPAAGCVSKEDVSAADASVRVLRLETEARHRVQAATQPRCSLGDAARRGRQAVQALADAVGPRHLAVACARRELISSVRRRLQQSRPDHAEPDAENACLQLLLEMNVELWYTQRRLLGPLHPECACTLHEISASLGSLLGRDPQRLFRAFPQWSTPALAAHAQGRAAELHSAIARLYSDPLPPQAC